MNESNFSILPPNDEPEGDYRSIGPRRWLAAWLGSIAVVAFFGNTLVISCVILYPKLRTITNVFITSLAISDLLVSLTIPWIIVGLVSTRGWPLPDETCILVAVLRFTCSGSSVWHLVTIGTNRMFLITTSSATYRKIYSRVNTAIILFITWLIPFSVIIVPYAIGATRLGYDDGPHMCSDLEEIRPDGTEYSIHAYLAGSWLTCIPLCMVLCVYLRIYIYIRLHVRKQNAWSTGQQHRNTAVATVSATVEDAGSTDKEGANDAKGGSGSNTDGAQVQSNQPTERSAQNPIAAATKPPVKKGDTLETRITKNTFYVVLGFFMCMVPYGIIILDHNLGIKGTPLPQAFLLFNVCMNPLIYGTKHPHFRGAIRNIFSGRISGPLVMSNSVATASTDQGGT
ncbi:beta-3 adrenergic receptor-like [Strongylocentrotus purpuratus]|uniref:G-protein coupled receptors family 1 profile domain-containing protein n=1 Tax=Strongylocentrotus purpuratus TaxID=7668 RepID=A0A7M7G3L2_STRPU|nr:beta-3 adrenergic receptor-like [Strongylocentrotus purpuratus]